MTAYCVLSVALFASVLALVAIGLRTGDKSDEAVLLGIETRAAPRGVRSPSPTPAGRRCWLE